MFSMVISASMLIAWVVSHNDVLIIGAGLFMIASSVCYLATVLKKFGESVVGSTAILTNPELFTEFMKRKDEK